MKSPITIAAALLTVLCLHFSAFGSNGQTSATSSTSAIEAPGKGVSQAVRVSKDRKPSIADKLKDYRLSDDKPAPLDLKGWESHSYPLGNGYFGVNVFGGIGEELWQFTEKSVFVQNSTVAKDAWDRVALSSLCELRLVQEHDPKKATGYGRQLDLNQALATVSYSIDGVTHTRKSLTSYPDRCFATRITASQPGKVAFRLKTLHSYLCEYRTGTVRVEGDTLVLSGETKPYFLQYEVRVAVETKGGTVRPIAKETEGEFVVEGADEAVVFVTLGTNYRLDPKVFTTYDPAQKLAGFPVPSGQIEQDMASARKAGWETVSKRQKEDYGRLFARTQIDLGGTDPTLPTERLLTDPNLAPPSARYLEELYFQFGRYLLIGSSRKGTLPANLQGTWNMPQGAPWTGGFWANINVQMNYWPAFTTGLEECFDPYYEFFKAAFPEQQHKASSVVQGWRKKHLEGGWTAGTGNNPYVIGGPGTTSGAGTGPFVILPMWDWYNFTGRQEILEKIWPFLLESSRFLVAAMEEQPDGTILCTPSWSPENQTTTKPKKHLEMPGTAYDQQLVYENHRITLAVAKLLKKSDPILPILEAQLPRLSPVIIGDSGQIKEFRQEHAYGEYGDPHHRHISHLIGLFPGTLISEKKEWLDAARVTLTLRGDKATGWGMAHRLNAWARIKDGDHCYALLRTLLEKGTLPNLWDTCPPFQIDGNFGGTSGIAEMLLQSHEGYIDLLPALPKEWNNGSFSGIRARGAFRISADWNGGIVNKVTVVSEGGSLCRIKLAGKSSWTITDEHGLSVVATYDRSSGVTTFPTKPGSTYQIQPSKAAVTGQTKLL